MKEREAPRLVAKKTQKMIENINGQILWFKLLRFTKCKKTSFHKTKQQR